MESEEPLTIGGLLRALACERINHGYYTSNSNFFHQLYHSSDTSYRTVCFTNCFTGIHTLASKALLNCFMEFLQTSGNFSFDFHVRNS